MCFDSCIKVSDKVPVVVSADLANADNLRRGIIILEKNFYSDLRGLMGR